jgi:hypothetical protein
MIYLKIITKYNKNNTKRWLFFPPGETETIKPGDTIAVFKLYPFTFI